jgi:hypothetical protein
MVQEVGNPKSMVLVSAWLLVRTCLMLLQLVEEVEGKWLSVEESEGGQLQVWLSHCYGKGHQSMHHCDLNPSHEAPPPNTDALRAVVVNLDCELDWTQKCLAD